jgi:hypothetical protein
MEKSFQSFQLGEAAMTLKAIQTKYNGFLFRSRLEARWAIFFDTLGIDYQYELEGFELGKAGRYLPDFYLPHLDCWYEVKPGKLEPEDERKIEAFLEQLDHGHLILACGDIPSPAEPDACFRKGGGWAPGISCGFPGGGWDFPFLWCSCLTGQHFGIQWCGYGNRIKCDCPGQRCDKDNRGVYDPKIVAAFEAARSAQFEFNKTPKGPRQ